MEQAWCLHQWEEGEAGFHTCTLCMQIRKPPTDQQIAENMRRKMRSGNQIQVERTTITRRDFAEWGDVVETPKDAA